MKLNTKTPPIYTQEGGKAKHISPEFSLRRSVLSTLLWENQYYEDGVEIADRIKSLIPQVEARKVADLAIEAREKMKLRHIPLFLVREMARLSTHKKLVAKTLERIIQRPDELTEFLAIYWKEGKQSLSAQVKKGLAEAFNKFNEYQLAKYNTSNQIKLRDVLFLCHSKPANKEIETIRKKLIEGELQPADTWEKALKESKGENKKIIWESLLKENKLGAMALLRNLRNFKEESVDESLVFSALDSMKVERVLPFRFITASRYAPQWESQIEAVMLRCLDSQAKLSGKTILLVDVSGSMKSEISDNSELSRMDAACGLAILLREICQAQVYTFSNGAVLIPARRGFALRDSIISSQPHGGTYLGNAIAYLNQNETYDRIIVITDEQAHDNIGNPKGLGYVINVASNKNGVGYGNWIHIDGWSEAVIDWVREYERLGNAP